MNTNIENMELPEIDGIVRATVLDFYVTTTSKLDIFDMMEAYEEYTNAIMALEVVTEIDEVLDCAVTILNMANYNR
jgi:hypothetical protein